MVKLSALCLASARFSCGCVSALQLSNAFVAGLFPVGGAVPASGLEAVHLGGTRISDIAPLRLATQLTALTLCGEPLDAGVVPVSRVYCESVSL